MGQMIFRASEIHLLMGNAKSIDDALLTDEIKEIQKKPSTKRTDVEKSLLAELLFNTLSAGAKTLVKDKVRKAKHNAPHKFSGSKETEKGHLVEDDAILFLMQQEFISAEKNTIRFNNDWITGEPDIISDIVYDTKCPWTYWSMPYFKDDIESKSLDAGYDWQQLCYLWLLRENNEFEPKIIDEAQLKYILMPTPNKCLGKWDDFTLHIDFVESMNPVDRISTYSIKWDALKIEMIKTKITAARKYAETLEL
ncbi:MAG: hypothetical protein ABS863_00475 [Aerococcus urinaeequi]